MLKHVLVLQQELVHASLGLQPRRSLSSQLVLQQVNLQGRSRQRRQREDRTERREARECKRESLVDGQDQRHLPRPIRDKEALPRAKWAPGLAIQRRSQKKLLAGSLSVLSEGHDVSLMCDSEPHDSEPHTTSKR